MEHLTWWGIFTACLGALTPLLAILLGMHFQNRSDKKKSDAKLGALLQEYGFHDHTEHAGPLHVEGIRRPRIG